MHEDLADTDPDLLERLTEADARADQAERALVRLQGSFTMTVGQLVIDAGRSPRRMMMLPFTLLRMRRNRRALRATTPREAAKEVKVLLRDTGLGVRPGRLLLPRRLVTLDERPSYVVIGPARLASLLHPYAHVSEALPHNAPELVRALDPDAVIVHAHAGHHAGAWAPLGEPGEAVRESVLIAVRDMCRRLGRPIALVHDPATAPGLTPFAATCDLVIEVGDEAQLPVLLAKATGTHDV